MGSLIAVNEWKTPVSVIPTQSVGEWHVKKRMLKRGAILPVEASWIEAALFVSPVEVTILREGLMEADDSKSVWMSDTPREYFMACDLVNRTEGPRVLVGGLGLGLVCHLLLRRRDIESVVVIEKAPEVIEMVAPYLPVGVEVIEGDFLEMMWKLSVRGQEFETVIADLWKGREDADHELFRDCRCSMEDWFMDAKHLFWAFQEEVDDEQSRYAMMSLDRQGVLR